jgi:hypothetical protein
MEYTIRDKQTGETFTWNLSQVLEEINRDHSDDWEDYNEEDWAEGWKTWCEGDVYTMEKINGISVDQFTDDETQNPTHTSYGHPPILHDKFAQLVDYLSPDFVVFDILARFLSDEEMQSFIHAMEERMPANHNYFQQ